MLFTHRADPATHPELIDDPAQPYEAMVEAHRMIQFVNRRLGGRQALVQTLEGFARGWRPEQTHTFLDVGTGSADLPVTVADWARERGHRVRIVALDLSWACCRFAREETRSYPEIEVLRGDVYRLPARDGDFDYVLTGMFLHHLSDEGIVRTLRVFDRIARRGVIIGDLLRRVRAYLWAKFFCSISKSRLAAHDGPVSVLRSFTPAEMRAYCAAAGIADPSITVHFGHRFICSWAPDKK